MAVLTGATPDPRSPGYCQLEVDRGCFASLPEELLAPLGLVVGAELTVETLDRLQALADIEAAYRAAVRAQTRRPHARADLRRRLIQKQHPPSAVEVALERLAGQGLLDDRRFAHHFAATRATRGRAPARLVMDLLQQGVDRSVAEEAVRQALKEEAVDPDVEMRRIAARRVPQLAGLPAEVAQRRLLAYLARRGYQGEGVRATVQQVISAMTGS